MERRWQRSKVLPEYAQKCRRNRCRWHAEEQRIQTLDNLDGEEPGIEDGDAGPAVLF